MGLVDITRIIYRNKVGIQVNSCTFALAFFERSVINYFFNHFVSDFMKQYEVTFIVDPVLSGDEIKATAQAYVDMLQQEGATIVHVDEMAPGAL